MIGIYKITSPTGRVYIGQSSDIERRFATYKGMRCKDQPKLYNSFLKYGVEKHDFEVLIECDSSDLSYYETFYITRYHSHRVTGLNCKMDGDVCYHSEETKEKIRQKLSVIMKGNTRGKFCKHTEEFKQKTSERMMGNKICVGRKVSDEHMKKVSDAFKKQRAESIEDMSFLYSKLVLNTETGIFYTSITEAATTKDLSKNHLSAMLRGVRRNKTSFIYA